MYQAAVQGQTEEQRLESGTRRPPCAHAVHLASDVGIEEVAGPYQGKRFHALVIDQEGGGILDTVPAAPVDIVAGRGSQAVAEDRDRGRWRISAAPVSATWSRTKCGA